MARPGPQTQAKRRREQEKKDKRRAKDEKKALKKALAKGQDPLSDAQDSDDVIDPSLAVEPVETD